MSKKYIGITIGPIYDTMKDASSPASLWFSSFLFSDITKRICEELTKEQMFVDLVLYSPYYGKGISVTDGIGKFHDRIICSATDYDDKKMKEFILKIKSDTINCFPENLYSNDSKKKEAVQFLIEYLQIHYIVLEETQVQESNCLLVISPYLDALELMKTVPMHNQYNPLKKMVMGDNRSVNKRVKESSLFQKQTSNSLVSEKGSIWSIEEIASGMIGSKGESILPKNAKSRSYYAVVQADGDGMGAFLQELTTDKIETFSKVCLEYTKKAAQMIQEFGGMTIYAGGDDLLYLAPVINGTGKTIFSLCYEINKCFGDCINEKFKEIELLPTISSGISIQYMKSPLYEAFQKAGSLLFSEAKTGDKNQMAITVQKHSGQTVTCKVSNKDYEGFEALLQLGNELDNQDEMVHSVIYTLELFKDMIELLNKQVIVNGMTEEAYLVRWLNLFDNPDQKKAITYIESLGKKLYHMYLCSENQTAKKEEDEKEKKEKASMDEFLMILRLKKFMVEKGE